MRIFYSAQTFVVVDQQRSERSRCTSSSSSRGSSSVVNCDNMAAGEEQGGAGSLTRVVPGSFVSSPPVRGQPSLTGSEK